MATNRQNNIWAVLLLSSAVVQAQTEQKNPAPDPAVVENAVQNRDDEIDRLLSGFDDIEPRQNQEASDSSVESLLAGFDDSAEQDMTTGFSNKQSSEQTVKVFDPLNDSNWSLSGFVSFNSHYNYADPNPAATAADFSGWSRARLRFFPKLSVDLNDDTKVIASVNSYYDGIFDLAGKGQYSDDYLGDSRSDIELREFNLSTTIAEQLDIKIGRQVLIWGKSDNLRVTDIINPVDAREPGMIDLQDLRLPTGMVRIDYYHHNWQLNVALIGEHPGNKAPVFGSEYYPAEQPLPQHIRPQSGSDWQTAIALNGTFAQWDMSFYFADAYQQDSYLRQQEQQYSLSHSRFNMLGTAANWVTGSWLLKTEVALLDDLELSFLNQSTQRYDLLLGFDYQGFDSQTLTIEYAVRHLPNYDNLAVDNGFAVEQNESELVLRYNGKFFRETVDVNFFAYYFGLSAGASRFYRASISYKMFDNWDFTGGLMWYNAGDKDYFERIANNDRLYGEIRFDF